LHFQFFFWLEYCRYPPFNKLPPSFFSLASRVGHRHPFPTFFFQEVSFQSFLLREESPLAFLWVWFPSLLFARGFCLALPKFFPPHRLPATRTSTVVRLFPGGIRHRHCRFFPPWNPRIQFWFYDLNCPPNSFSR